VQDYDAKPEVETPIDMSKQAEASGEMNFATSSKRAASRPRRKANNAMAEESNVAVDDDGRNANLVLPDQDKGAQEIKEKQKGHIEEFLKSNPFPIMERVSFTLPLVVQCNTNTSHTVCMLYLTDCICPIFLG